MRSITARMCTAVAVASLAVMPSVFAQNDMDPTRMPPAADNRPLADKDMAANKQADQVVQNNLMKIAADPAMAGDKLFICETSLGNLWEVEVSRLVAEKSQDPQVKELAKMIMQDHSMNQEKLTPLAVKAGLEVPKNLTSMKQAKLEILRTLPADKLDIAFLADMKAGHAMTVTSFIDHEKVVTDAPLKAYITESLPKLKEHTGHILKVAVAKGLPGDMVMGGKPDTGADHAGHDMK